MGHSTFFALCVFIIRNHKGVYACLMKMILQITRSSIHFEIR